MDNHNNVTKLNGIVQTLNAIDCTELLEWLKNLPLAYFNKNFNLLLVHAGIHPAWDTTKTLTLAKEIESIFKSNLTGFSENMYGDQPDTWNDNLASWDRTRCIVNYLTRMRFCTITGKLELHTKGEVLNAPVGYMPWYMVPKRKTQNTTVVFGHWSALAGNVNHPNIIALDTGCRWGKRLTAYCIEDQKFFYVENEK